MGAIRPRAKARAGPLVRPNALKLSVMGSFISIAISQSPFYECSACTNRVQYFCFIRRKHITAVAGLSSRRFSDFRRMFCAICGQTIYAAVLAR